METVVFVRDHLMIGLIFGVASFAWFGVIVAAEVLICGIGALVLGRKRLTRYIARGSAAWSGSISCRWP